MNKLRIKIPDLPDTEKQPLVDSTRNNSGRNSSRSAGMPSPRRLKDRQFFAKQKQKRSHKAPVGEKQCYIGTFEEAEEYMQHNSLIMTGYRINFDSCAKITRSLFMLHNETINIWTHLIGCIMFIILVRHTFTSQEPSEFYYQVLLHNSNRTGALTDLGIPYNRLYNRVRQEFEKTQQSMSLTSVQMLSYLDDIKSDLFPSTSSNITIYDGETASSCE